MKPEASLHLTKARENYRLYQELKQGGQHLHLAAAVLFLAMRHLAYAYLAETAPAPFAQHGVRSAAIRKHLPQIFDDYEFRRTRKNWARYHAHKPEPTPELIQQYETQQFARIAAELRRLGFTLDA